MLHSPHNEKKILEEAASGSKEAFETLFRLHKDKLYSFLLKLTHDEAAAEDCVQEMFLKLWLQKESLSEIEKFDSYLFKMAQNYSFNAFKRMAHETLIISELQKNDATSTSTPLENLSFQELRRKLAMAIEKLSPQQKAVYLLSREKGLNHAEIAAQLGISPSTVNNHMTKALAFIKEYLGKHFASYGGLLFLFELFATAKK
ncbi:RNA polymerase sigma factor [Chitinophagaceae bacterium LWZ2-11]